MPKIFQVEVRAKRNNLIEYNLSTKFLSVVKKGYIPTNKDIWIFQSEIRPFLNLMNRVFNESGI